MRINLAICDDSAAMLTTMQQQVAQFHAVQQVETFSAMEDFWEALEEGKLFDAVLMDIEWGQAENGIDFAQMLYEKSPQTRVIYVTGYAEQYIHTIFFQESNLLGYLSKPLKQEELEVLLNKVIRQQEKQKEKLVVYYKKVMYQFFTDEILYLESKAHVTHIYTDKTVYHCRERLDQIGARLPAWFVRPHKSFIVNMEKIRRIDSKAIVLQNEASIPVSRVRYDGVKEQFFRYKGQLLEEQYGGEQAMKHED